MVMVNKFYGFSLGYPQSFPEHISLYVRKYEQYSFSSMKPFSPVFTDPLREEWLQGMILSSLS